MYAQRLDKVRKNLAAQGLAHTLVSDLASISYLIGRSVAHVGERLLALYVPVNGKAILYVNELFPIEPGEDFDIVYHKDGDISTAQMARNLPAGNLGIDNFWYCQFLMELQQQRPDISAVPGSFAVNNARMIKDPFEIDAMRKASAINDQVFAHVPELIEEGISETQLAQRIGALFERYGDPENPSIPLVCFGANAAEPHHANDSTVLKAGDAIVVDGGQCSFGYCSDMTRTYFYKSITDKQRQAYEIVCEANRRAREFAKPGVTFAQVDAVARDYITQCGFGKYFTHRTGHGIGRTGHEHPYVAAGNHDSLKAGMCFTVEPGIYIPGEFGVRIEDVVLVTENGLDTLNTCPKEIMILG